MTNRTTNGIIMLCLSLSTFFVSCKKENADPAINQPGEAVFNDPVDIVNEPEVVADVSAASDQLTAKTAGVNAVLSIYQRRNLIFGYTSESSSALSSFLINNASYWAFEQSCCTSSIQLSAAYARSGGFSTRYQLNKTDADVSASKRSETGRYTKSELNPKVERWYAASYYLPAAFVSDAAAESVTQWHTTSTQYPPLSLWTQNGQWRLVQFGKISTILGNYDKGKWTDMVFHVKWSSGTDGLLEIWKNGVKILSKTGANINAGILTGAYMRTGIYKWPWKSGSTSTTTQRVIYIDDVRIGNASATYNDVVPGL